MNVLINYLNDEAVYRTAPATPGLFNILRRNKHAHPLVYMRGIKSEDLIAIVDFLYYGEANIYQENLDNFLGIAK